MLAALGGLEHADCPVPSGLQSGCRLVAFLPSPQWGLACRTLARLGALPSYSSSFKASRCCSVSL